MKSSKRTILGTLLAFVLMFSTLSATPALAAAPESATNTIRIKTAFIPEWYQYCANTRPIGATAGKSGYMNAYKEAGGVTCKWWVISWGAGFPHAVQKYYTWDTVCRYYKSSYSSTKNNYPWCR